LQLLLFDGFQITIIMFDFTLELKHVE